MTNGEYVAFLQWALPRLKLRWAGYRNVRGQVCKRIRRRLVQLKLADLSAYRAWLETEPAEWSVLREMCGVTISRFYRDRSVWDSLRDEILPAIADAATRARDQDLRCWSIGCASGEEPYTFSIVWGLALAHQYPGLRLRVLATDVDESVLRRAEVAEYSAGTIREIPKSWLNQVFERHGESFRLRGRFRSSVELRQEDVRRTLPAEEFRVVLCRNLIFTYFDEELQRETLSRVLTRLSEDGTFIIGRHERLPSGTPLEPLRAELGIYRQRV